MDNNRFAVLKTNMFKTNNTKKSVKETNDKSDTRTPENTFKNSNSKRDHNFQRNNNFNRTNLPNNHRNNFMKYTEKKEEKKPEFNLNNDDFPTLG
jgi:hypothetical protein